MKQFAHRTASDEAHAEQRLPPAATEEHSAADSCAATGDWRRIALEQARESDRAWRAARLRRLRNRVDKAPLLAGMTTLLLLLLSNLVYFWLRSDNAPGDPLSAWEGSVRIAPHLLHLGMLFVIKYCSDRWKKELAQDEAEEKELTQDEADPRPCTQNPLTDPPTG